MYITLYRSPYCIGFRERKETDMYNFVKITTHLWVFKKKAYLCITRK